MNGEKNSTEITRYQYSLIKDELILAEFEIILEFFLI